MEDESNGTLVCACRELGGISVAGWIVLMALLGLAMGAVLGALGALWLVGRRESKHQVRDAVEWRIHTGTQPQGTPINRTNPGLLSKNDLSTFSPMAQYKKQKSCGGISSHTTMHSLDGSGETRLQSLHSPRQSILLEMPRQGCSQRSTQSTSLRAPPRQPPSTSLKGRRHSSHSCISLPADAFSPTSHGEDAPLKSPQHPSRDVGGPSQQRQVEEACDVVVQVGAPSVDLNLEVGTPDCPESSKPRETVLQKQYELEELEPEWHGIMSHIDNMLAEQARRPLTADERPVVMRSLLHSSPEAGAGKAMSDAVEALLEYRITQGTSDELCLQDQEEAPSDKGEAK